MQARLALVPSLCASCMMGQVVAAPGVVSSAMPCPPLVWRLARRCQFSSMRWSPDPTRSPACQKAKAARFADAIRRQRKPTPSLKPPAARPCRRRRGLHRGPAPVPRAADFSLLPAAALPIVATETVGEKARQFGVFLAHETAVRKRAFAHQVHHRAHSRRSGDLDRRIHPLAQRLAVDLLGE